MAFHHARALATTVVLVGACAVGGAEYETEDAVSRRGVVRMLSSDVESPVALRSISKNAKRVRVVSNDGQTVGRATRQLDLTLFDGTSLVANKTKVIDRGANDYTWFGSSESGAAVSMTVRADVVFGRIQDGDEMTVVRSVAPGLILLESIEAVRDTCATVDSSFVRPGDLNLGDLTINVPSTIDVMIVYTEETRRAMTSWTWLAELLIAAQITNAIDETNAAFENSNIIHTINLVHMMEIDGDMEGDTSSEQLSWIYDAINDSSHSIARARERYDADVVSLWVEDMDGACGRGYIYDGSSNFDQKSTHVVERSCQLSKYSFMHELGHNFGARHDWAVDTNTDPWRYAHGYVMWDVDFPLVPMRSVMAYDDLCDDLGISCPRVAVYSNPDLSFFGELFGIEEGADNARLHNETGRRISRLR